MAYRRLLLPLTGTAAGEAALKTALMVARTWEWDLWYVMSHFGWRTLLAVPTAALLYFLVFRRELQAMAARPPVRDVEVPDADARGLRAHDGDAGGSPGGRPLRELGRPPELVRAARRPPLLGSLLPLEHVLAEQLHRQVWRFAGGAGDGLRELQCRDSVVCVDEATGGESLGFCGR